jgi:hypothetical protein
MEVAVFKRVFKHPQFLVVYSATITVVFLITTCLNFARPVHGAGKTVDFDRIQVHRIDIVEPDGTPRMIIADRAEYPGSFFHGKEIARPDRRDSAGMLFINDEGTEDGGLIYGGASIDGKPSSFSHLSFDQYDQDQTVVLGTELSPDGSRNEGITLNDAPEKPITPDMYREAERIKAMPHGAARKTAWTAFMKKYPSLLERASLERNDDGSVGLTLRDQEGRPRLQIGLDVHGQPAIQWLDAQGKVKRTISIPES